MRVGLVTCKVLPEPDPDAAPLDAALRERGHTPVIVAWDDISNHRERLRALELDVIVIRSAWNYFIDPEAFVQWVASVSECAPMINSMGVVNWNIHKRYLLQLASSGVPIVPTKLIQPNAAGSAADAIASFGDVVIKPAISAGSFGAKRFAVDERAAATDHVESLLGNGDVLIQPYLSGFENPGERSLVWVDGEWTHAVRKNPRFEGQDENVDASEPPTRQELKIANAALHAVPYRVRYARVDLVETESGSVLSELELMEPSLFFNHSATALARFVKMIEECYRQDSYGGP